MRYAARLNAFRIAPDLGGSAGAGAAAKLALPEAVARAASVPGLTALDLNYPDHCEGPAGRDLVARARESGLELNGFAMRYGGDPRFRAGAFTHPDAAVRRAAIDLTRRGIDALAAAGGGLMTLWLGQDGFDYPFQCDYARLWELEVAGIAAVAAHDPAINVSIEYKPNEPRAFSLLGDVGTTLLAVREAGAANLGVTLDFAHVLYAGEQPAAAAALVARHSRLLGLHLNDGYGGRDDGLMVGAVHLVQTLELLRQVRRDGYAGALYFDTFPDAVGLDPVAECAANIATCEALLAAVERLEADKRLPDILARQDPVAGQAVVRELTLGRAGPGPS